MPMARLVGMWRGWPHMILVLITFSLSASRPGASLNAQTCGSDYVVKEGESLAGIASKAYGSSLRWTPIFLANQDRLGANASSLVPGTRLRIPCPNEKKSAAGVSAPGAPSVTSNPAEPRGAIELLSAVRRIEFLTAGGYVPFTDRSLSNGGMIAHIVSAAMDVMKERVAGSLDYRVSWLNSRTQHLNVLLNTRSFDAGFPWLKPDCDRLADLPQDVRDVCQNFLFSNPLYEVFIALFVKSNSQITFEKDDDIIGRTLCLPAGFSAYELDKGGRNWVRDRKVILLRPQTIEECFRLLDSNSVSAVVTADLTGKAVSTALKLGGEVKALSRPVAIETLHLIVSKTHPHAGTVLYYINAATARLRESGEYDKIVDSHLSRFWTAQDWK